MTRALGIVLCSCLASIVAHPAYGGRPLSTEDAGVSGKWKSSVELGGEYARRADGEQDYVFLFAPIYGLTDRLEFSAELPFGSKSPQGSTSVGGLEDIVLVLKTLIADERGQTPAFLVKTVAKLSTGDREKALGSGDTDMGFVVASSKAIHPFIIHANLGYTFVGTAGDSALRNYLMYGLAGEYSGGDRVKLVGEIYGESDSHYDIGAFKHHNPQVLAGMTYAFSDRIVCDAAVKAGIEHSGLGYGMTAGMSVTF